MMTIVCPNCGKGLATVILEPYGGLPDPDDARWWCNKCGYEFKQKPPMSDRIKQALVAYDTLLELKDVLRRISQLV